MSNFRKKIEEQIIEKAMKDDSFRKKLLENPKIVFELETGVKLPESLQIKVLQEDRNNVYLVLPPFRADVDEDELSEAELASVAGGTANWGGPGQGT
ncbi:MAG: NHLP leader peptide family RiPP precursor [Bacteroidota bacterium]